MRSPVLLFNWIEFHYKCVETSSFIITIKYNQLKMDSNAYDIAYEAACNENKRE